MWRIDKGVGGCGECALFARGAEVMRCVLLCVLETADGRFCWLDALEVLEMSEVLEVIRCVLLFMLEAVEGGLCLLDVSEAMRCGG